MIIDRLPGECSTVDAIIADAIDELPKPNSYSRRVPVLLLLSGELVFVSFSDDLGLRIAASRLAFLQCSVAFLSLCARLRVNGRTNAPDVLLV